MRNESGAITTDPRIQLCLDKEGVAPEVIQMNLEEPPPPPATVPWMRMALLLSCAGRFTNVVSLHSQHLFLVSGLCSPLPGEEMRAPGLHYLCTTLRCRADTQLLGPR